MKVDKEPAGERQEKIEYLKIDLDKIGWIEEKLAEEERGEPERQEMGAIEIEVEAFNAELERAKGEVNFFLDEATYEAKLAELGDKRRGIMEKINKFVG